MPKPSMKDLSGLSPRERLELAQVLWDSVIDEDSQSVELTADQRRVLDERLADYEANPDAGASWSEVRERIHKAR